MLYLTIGDVGSFAAASKMLFEGGATIADIPQAHDAAAGAGQHGELRWRIAPWTGVRMDSVSVTLEYWCTKPPHTQGLFCTRRGGIRETEIFWNCLNSFEQGELSRIWKLAGFLGRCETLLGFYFVRTAFHSFYQRIRYWSFSGKFRCLS